MGEGFSPEGPGPPMGEGFSPEGSGPLMGEGFSPEGPGAPGGWRGIASMCGGRGFPPATPPTPAVGPPPLPYECTEIMSSSEKQAMPC